MQFKEVVGWRRSIRWFLPWRPVEREKVQTILEAIYRAPRVLDIDFVRAVVVYRDSLSEEELESLKLPTTTAQLDMAPVYILVYADTGALQQALDGRSLKQLVDVGALNASHGWSHAYIDNVIIPQVFRPILDDPDRVPLRMRPGSQEEGPLVSRSLLRLARTAIGIAHAHALLAAFEEGLAAQLSAISPMIHQMAKVPPTWVPGSPILLGYHAESWEAGGQRAREPFEDAFFEGRYGVPFQRDPQVVERLKAENMIQPAGPLPWRRDELRALGRMFGLPE